MFRLEQEEIDCSVHGGGGAQTTHRPPPPPKGDPSPLRVAPAREWSEGSQTAI